MTLAYGKALQEETIKRIAARHNATPAQVVPAGAEARLRGDPSSTKRENSESNLLAQQLLQLSDEDMAQIAALESNGRLVSPEGLAPDWD